MVQRVKRKARRGTRGTGISLPDFVSIVDKYKKAVVGIEVVHQPNPQRGFSFGMPWERRDDTQNRTVNIGTGFVFDPRGYILTNETRGTRRIANHGSRVWKKEPLSSLRCRF